MQTHNPNAPVFLSSFMNVEGRTSGSRTDLCPQAATRGLKVVELEIQSLGEGWQSIEGKFKSGAGPIFALERAAKLLESAEADVVRISGVERLRSGYDRDERAALMDIFDGVSVPDAYTQLTYEFLRHRGWSEAEFFGLARALEANYRSTFGVGAESARDDEMVTELFRRVDCANPVLDFEGELVLGTRSAADELRVQAPVELLAIATASIPDGPEEIAGISTYTHLHQAYQGIAYATPRLEKATGLIMELYTCFPVVPLAFIVAAGWATTPAEIQLFLESQPITLSGGMNLARAPWNNPALRGLIMVIQELERIGDGIGLVHGNGGLGGLQGICLCAHSALTMTP